MKKKPLVITLLATGIALVLLSLILAVSATAKLDIIGGASFPTFSLVFWHSHGGIYATTACIGVLLMVAALVVGFLKKSK